MGGSGWGNLAFGYVGSFFESGNCACIFLWVRGRVREGV